MNAGTKKGHRKIVFGIFYELCHVLLLERLFSTQLSLLLEEFGTNHWIHARREVVFAPVRGCECFVENMALVEGSRKHDRCPVGCTQHWKCNFGNNRLRDEGCFVQNYLMRLCDL